MSGFSSPPVLASALLLLGAGLSGCKPSSPSAASAGSSAKAPVKQVAVEVRADGLGYLPGAATPFTGEGVEAFADAPELVRKTEPWQEGRRNGEVREFFKDGTIKSTRRYKNGVPEFFRAHHKNGKLKFEMPLNAADLAEGPFRRWHSNGQLAAEAVFDSQERWHGESKAWNEAGELRSHLVLDHGEVKEIIFETEEAKAERLTPRPAPGTPAAAE